MPRVLAAIDMLKPPLEADMQLSIHDFIKKYNLSDTERIIIEILNGKIDM